ncbi:MAG: DUF4038 domain-containing protein [Hyphomonadaceae bacterium]|nr:DUF4038 domain-containing protein [Hyphomonadaceae bacterium]
MRVLRTAERLLLACLLGLWAATSAFAAPDPANLAAHWAIDEGAGGTTANAASASYGGTLTGTPTWTAGRLGGALAFDGTDYVQVGNIAPINGVQKVTLAAWVRRNAAGAVVVLGKQNSGANVGIYAHSNGSIRFYVSGGSNAYGAFTLNDTAWHHVALVFDGALTGNANRLKGYVDGAQRTLSFSGTVGATTTTDTTAFRLGRWGNTYSNGAIDDVWLYTRVLSLAEIRDLAQFVPDTEPPGVPTALTAGLVTAVSAAFSWTAATDNVAVTGYEVFRNGALVGTVTTTSFSDSSLAPTTAYTYTVKAVDGAGLRSNESAPLILTTNAIVPGAAFPLRLSADKRYLEDANGNPFIMRGDSPWSLIVGPNDAGLAQYLDDRKARGVNAVLVELIEPYFTGPADAFGNVPFSNPHDFTTPNEAYFAHADRVIREAEQRGILVLLFPAYLGWQGGSEGYYQELLSQGVDKMRQYGRYVGNRYRNFTNILWVLGGDHGAHQAIEEIRAMVEGIEETFGPNGIYTVHSGQGSSFDDGYTRSIDTWVDLDNLYYYSDCRVHVSQMQAMYNRTPTFGFFFIEGHYEGESSTALCRREQEYWPPLLGGTGYFYGNRPVWLFDSGWQSALNSSGAQDLRRANMLFASRPYYFTPAQNALTAGAATGANFVAVGRSANGETLIAYTPDQHALTIDMTKVGGTTAQAWWYNPRADGAPTNLGTFPTTGTRSFTPPSAGDWALVLDNSALGLSPPGTVAAPAPDTQAPTQPGAPVIGATTATSIALTWAPATDNVAVTRYKVFRDDVEVGTAPSAAFTDTQLSPGTTYSYKVQAFDAANLASPFSGATPGATAAAQCSDGADNDGDQLIDFPADPGCASAADNDESNPDIISPTAPGALQTSTVTSTSITVTWTASTDNIGVTGYFASGGTNSVPVATTGLSFTFNGLAPSTTYQLTIEARDAAGNAASSSINAQTLAPPPAQCGDGIDNDGDQLIDFPADPGCTSLSDADETDVDGAAPSVPNGLAAQAVTATSLTLTWNASTDNVGVAKYRVYRNGALLSPQPTGTSFNDSGLSGGVSYSYTVDAVDAAGNASAPSIALIVTTLDGSAPSIPAGLAASNVTQTSLTLSWTASTDNVGVAKYLVYRNGVLLSPQPTTTSFSDSGLTQGTAYAYRVAAADAAGNTSQQSSVLNVTTVDGAAPSVPGGLAASNVTQTTLTLTWTASTDNIGVARYRVYRNGTLLSPQPTAASFSDSGLTASTTYSYTVDAQDAAGNTSAQSSPAFSVTTAAQGSTPVGLVAAYSLNENAGSTARNSASASYNGTFAGTPTWSAAGKYGAALVFDGTDSVEIGNITQINGAQQVTVEAWMKRGASGSRVLIGKQTSNHDVALEFWTGGTLDAGLSNGSWAYGRITLNDSAWHHVATVFNGTLSGNANRLKVYVDGVQRTLTFSGTIPATTTTNTTPFRLGRMQDDYSNGMIDEVRVYNRALSQAEVQADMNTPLP